MHVITSLEFNYFQTYITKVSEMSYRQIQSDLIEWRNKGYTDPDIKCNKKRDILEGYWVELAMRVIEVYDPVYTELDIQDDIPPVEYEVIECENGEVIDPVSEQESLPVEDVITHVIVPFTRRYNNCVPFTRKVLPPVIEQVHIYYSPTLYNEEYVTDETYSPGEYMTAPGFDPQGRVLQVRSFFYTDEVKYLAHKALMDKSNFHSVWSQVACEDNPNMMTSYNNFA